MITGFKYLNSSQNYLRDTDETLNKWCGKFNYYQNMHKKQWQHIYR